VQEWVGGELNSDYRDYDVSVNHPVGTEGERKASDVSFAGKNGYDRPTNCSIVLKNSIM